jgi:hypothetical protein
MSLARLPTYAKPVEVAEPNQPEPPSEFLCPINCELMTDPIVLMDGFSYEREAVIEWLSEYRMASLMIGAPVANAIMLTTVLRVLINGWREKNMMVAAAAGAAAGDGTGAM